MKKLMYKDLEGNLCIVNPVAKEVIESQVGPMSDEEYKALVISSSIPEGITFKELEEADIPTTREYRDAWDDVTEDTTINLDMAKVKTIELKKLRTARDEELKKLDVTYLQALEGGDPAVIDAVKAKKQALRDVTDPLKQLNATGHDNAELLSEIKALAVLPQGE